MKSLKEVGIDGLTRLFGKRTFRANAKIPGEIDVNSRDENDIDLDVEVRMIIINQQHSEHAIKTVCWVWGQDCGVHVIFGNRYILRDELMKFRGRDVSHIVISNYGCELLDLQFVDRYVCHTIVALSEETRRSLGLI